MSQLKPVVFLAAIFFLNFLARIIASPLMPVIEQELRLSHGQSGALFLILAAGYFVSLTGSGVVSSRLKHRNTIIVSAACVGVALLLTSQSAGLLTLRLGLLLLGMAAGLYLPSAIAALTALVSARHWGKAIAIHEVAPNLACVCAPLLVEITSNMLDWRGIMLVIGAVSLLTGLGFALLFGKGADFPGIAPSPGAIRQLMGTATYWIMVFLFSAGISGTLGVYSMLPLYLTSEAGFELDSANTLVALSRAASMGAALVSGYLTDRFGARASMTGSLWLTGISTVLLGAAPATWITPVVYLQAILAVGFFPAAFAVLSSTGTSGSRNISVSLTIPPAFLLGAGLSPTVVGMAGDAGSFAHGIMVVGGVILTAGLVARRL